MALLSEFATATALIRDGLVFLASTCDGASSEDGHGFSKFDSDTGHDLAVRVRAGAEFSVKQLAFMGALCTKYRRQLLAYEFDAADMDAIKAFVAAAKAGDIEAAPKADKPAENEYFLTNGRLVGESGKALKVRLCDGTVHWLPRSQVKPGTEFGGAPIDFAVKTWFARKERFPVAPALAAYETPAAVPAPAARREAPRPAAPVVAPAPRAPRPVHIVD